MVMSSSMAWVLIGVAAVSVLAVLVMMALDAHLMRKLTAGVNAGVLCKRCYYPRDDHGHGGASPDHVFVTQLMARKTS
jgi:hypothetical protein